METAMSVSSKIASLPGSIMFGSYDGGDGISGGKSSHQQPVVEDRMRVNYLYCFVFPVKSKSKKQKDEDVAAYRQDILHRISSAGLSAESFYSVKKEEIYVKVGANDNRLLYEADLEEHRLELDAETMRVVARSDKDKERKPVCLEPPYDRSQHFSAQNLIDGSWEEISDETIEPMIKAQTSLSPFMHLFARYNSEWEMHHLKQNKVQIYKTYPDGSILRTSTRMKLIQIALERSTKEGGKKNINGPVLNMKGAGLNIGQMVFKKKVLAAFPLQTASTTIDSRSLTVDELFEQWSYFWKWPWTQPIDDVRDYFGEKIAIYFCFLGHYTLWLAPAALFGFCIFVAQMKNVKDNTGAVDFFNVSRISDDGTRTIVYTDLSVSPFNALFVSLWATFMLEFWKRREARFALKYGMIGFEAEETIRPEFKPSHYLPSPITGKRDPYLSSLNILAKLSFSTSIILSCVTVVVAAVAGIFVLKVAVTLPDAQQNTGLDEVNGGYLALVVNAVTIQLLAFVYKIIAEYLNDFENHKTDTEYEDALIAKTFIFSFVNSYATLFYMAFIKSNIEILGVPQFCNVQAREVNATDACFGDLGASLFIIFCTQIVVNNTLELFIPFVMGYVTKFTSLRMLPTALLDNDEAKRVILRSPAEDQFYLQPYDGTLGDFLELALQFGYATLFVTAFPIAPFLAFLNNWLEVRVDSYKLCKLCRRPEMKGAEDIGTWQYIFETVSFIAVVTNAAVTCFNSHVISDLIITNKNAINDVQGLQEIQTLKSEEALLVWVFVIFVVFVLVTKIVVGFVIPDVPGEVEIQVERNEYLVRKCLLRERDDEDEIDEDAEGIVHARGSDLRPSVALSQFDEVINETDPEIEKLLTHIAKSLLVALKGQSPESIFEKVDKNKSKGISRREFTDMLRNVLGFDSSISTNDIRQLVTALDTNSNGYVDHNEFVSLLKRATVNAPESSASL